MCRIKRAQTETSTPSLINPELTVSQVRDRIESIAYHKGRQPIHETLVASVARDFPQLSQAPKKSTNRKCWAEK